MGYWAEANAAQARLYPQAPPQANEIGTGGSAYDFLLNMTDATRGTGIRMPPGRVNTLPSGYTGEDFVLNMFDATRGTGVQMPAPRMAPAQNYSPASPFPAFPGETPPMQYAGPPAPQTYAPTTPTPPTPAAGPPRGSTARRQRQEPEATPEGYFRPKSDPYAYKFLDPVTVQYIGKGGRTGTFKITDKNISDKWRKQDVVIQHRRIAAARGRTYKDMAGVPVVQPVQMRHGGDVSTETLPMKGKNIRDLGEGLRGIETVGSGEGFYNYDTQRKRLGKAAEVLNRFFINR